VLEYGEGRDAAFREIGVETLPGAVRLGGSAPLVWVDVINPEEAEVRALADVLGWHHLVTEDVLKRGQRQKVEQYPNEVLSVVRYPRIKALQEAHTEVELVQTERILVSLHEDCGKEMDAIGLEVGRRQDLSQNGATAAMAVLFAHVADQYEHVIDVLEDLVEEQEVGSLEQISGDPAPVLRRAADARLAIARIRRSSGQLREVIGVYVRRELVNMEHSSELDLELRDALDHVVRAHDDLDVLHERMSTLADTRLAIVAYRQNEITKALSAYAAIFAVATVVTGWFGQNFHHLNGLDLQYGQWLSALIIIVAGALLYLYFHRRHWI
jgi:magnesium transporter